MRCVLPSSFPIGGLLRRHADKVRRQGVDMLAILTDAERYASRILGRELSDSERVRFCEAVRDATRASLHMVPSR